LYAIDAFQPPVDRHQLTFQHHARLPIGDGFPDDGVNDSVFVFKR
jgi:hypothetical protein